VTLREEKVVGENANTNYRWNNLFTKKPHEGLQRKARRLRNEDEDLQWKARPAALVLLPDMPKTIDG
jgi:hypothetical protein